MTCPAVKLQDVARIGAPLTESLSDFDEFCCFQVCRDEVRKDHWQVVPLQTRIYTTFATLELEVLESR